MLHPNTPTHSLSPKAKTLLRHLISLLPEAVPGSPETFTFYRQVHEDLGLPKMGMDWGTSLMNQGLVELAQWALDNGCPAITGLVVNRTTLSPGKGFFALYGRDLDFAWWEEEIRRAKTFPWPEV